ncbi:DUF6566 family protein [Paraburkholderia phenazinium]|uniref:DUF6566 domain-containing protein n=1 Tax=Paraburkholderia phenazinium TaxID=60549 RepID=A0A1G8EDC0_9BURK|nr:DUF6566 family protein [Paraburkholderia phenazinium]SDH67866.1 hypothetical protein SAMN05216466_11229 [Paraburkholderia phenazinium]
MPASTVSYGGFEIVVCSETNALGAWVAHVSLKNSEGKVIDLRPMTVQPEWLTEAEAVRDAVEWGQRFIDREFNTPQSHSWVAERARTEVWFRDVEEKSQGPDING